MTENLRAWWKVIAGNLATVLVITGLLWSVARPLAQDFIQDSVDDRIGALEKAIEQIQTEQRENALSSVRMESDLSTVKDFQKESREDVKSILKVLRTARDSALE